MLKQTLFVALIFTALATSVFAQVTPGRPAATPAATPGAASAVPPPAPFTAKRFKKAAAANGATKRR